MHKIEIGLKQHQTEPEGWETLKLALDEGLPVKTLKDLKEKYDFTDESLAKLLGVSTRTILRRKSGALTPDESTKVYELIRILNKAIELMETPENVIEWMHLKNPSLKGYSPIDLCTNIVGYEEVMNLLLRMEWGL